MSIAGSCQAFPWSEEEGGSIFQVLTAIADVEMVPLKVAPLFLGFNILPS